MLPFSDLVQEFSIGENHFLEYLQLKSAITSKFNITCTNCNLPASTLDLIKINPIKKKSLSKIYKIIANSDKSISLPSVKWECDLALTPNADFWNQICENTFSMSTNSNIQLIQYKIIHRFHFTGHRMFKMGLAQSDTCTHCSQNTPDTYLHATWNCTPVQQFWVDIISSLSNILGCPIPLSPSLCLLGDLSSFNHKMKINKPLLIALTIAKKTILINWKSKQAINIKHWKNLLANYISGENRTDSNMHKTEDQDSTW